MRPENSEAFFERFLEQRRHIEEALKARLTEDLRRLNLSVPHLVILHRLASGPGKGLRMAEIAERMGVSRAMATHLVDRLDEHRLIVRARDRADRRAVAVTLRPKGKRLLERFHAVERERLMQRFSELSADDRVRLLEAMHTLMELLGEPPPEGRRHP